MGGMRVKKFQSSRVDVKLEENWSKMMVLEGLEAAARGSCQYRDGVRGAIGWQCEFSRNREVVG